MKDQHPTAAEIAALGEDLLEGAEGAHVRDHVAACTTCSDAMADLRLLRSELASLYPDQPMPEDLAARIDDALATEAHPVSRETRSAPRRRMYMLAAAGAIVALSVGAIVIQTAGSSDDPSPVADAGTADATDDPEVEEEAQDKAEESVEDAAGEASADAAQSRLEADVRELLSESDETDTPDEVPPLDDTAEPEADVLSDPDEADLGQADPDEGQPPGSDEATLVPSCVISVINRSETPIASTGDYRHEGTESYLVVLPHSGDPDVVDAYVIDAACADSAAPSDDDVLEKRSYPRNSG